MPTDLPPCSVDGCERPMYRKKTGWCCTHYQRWLQHGDHLAGPPLRRERGTARPPCNQDDCDTSSRTLGMCDKHYRRLLHNGGPDAFAPKPAPTAAQLAALNAGRKAGKAAATANKLSDEERAERHRTATREWAQRWRAANPEEARRVRREQMATYDAEYRHRWNHHNRLRRQEIATPDAEAKEYAKILRGDPCCYCGAPMEHVDHIQPLARGGDGAWDNLTAACASCNFRKGARTLLDFLFSQMPQKVATP